MAGRVVACKPKKPKRQPRYEFRHELPPGVDPEEARRRCEDVVAMLAEAAR